MNLDHVTIVVWTVLLVDNHSDLTVAPVIGVLIFRIDPTVNGMTEKGIYTRDSNHGRLNLTSGQNVDCPGQKAAFGRCSTSQRSSSGGDCTGSASHSTQCCDSTGLVKESTCGWIYSKYGVKTNCPANMIVAGFCGVNNKRHGPVFCKYLSIRYKVARQK